MNTPKFPIKVIFHEDSSEWVLDNIDQVGSNLEWFDSDDPSENTDIYDANNRLLSVKVEKLSVLRFEFAQ